MFQSAKFFPIEDQIFEFDMLKWPRPKEAVCGMKEKFLNLYRENFFKCFYDSIVKSKKSWYMLPDDNSFILIFLFILFISFIHWFLSKVGFYDENTDQNAPKSQTRSNNSIKTKSEIKETNSTTDSVTDKKSIIKNDPKNNTQNLKENEVIVTKIKEQKYGFVLKPDKSKSCSSSSPDKGACYIRISEKKIETSKINKSNATVKQLDESQINSNKQKQIEYQPAVIHEITDSNTEKPKKKVSF